MRHILFILGSLRGQFRDLRLHGDAIIRIVGIRGRGLLRGIVNDQTDNFHHRVKPVQGVPDIVHGQLLWHVQHEQREGLLRATRDRNLLVEPCTGDLMEALLHHGLVVLWVREFKQDARCCFGQTKAALKVQFLTDESRTLHGQFMGGREKEGA